MKRVIKSIIWLLIVVALIMGGIRIIKKKKKDMAKIPVMKQYSIVVDTITPGITNFDLSLPYLAIVESDKDITVSTKLAGRILQIKKSGDTVNKGEIVLKIDDESERLKLKEINFQIDSIKADIGAKQVALKNNELTHGRTKALLDVKGASVEQYQSEANKIAAIRAGIDALNNKILLLKEQSNEIKNLLTYTKIKAPFTALVGKTMARAGDMAMPGKPLLNLQSEENKYLLLRMPADLKPKQLIYKGKTYSLKVLNNSLNGLVAYRADITAADAVVGERLEVKVVIFKGTGVKVPLNAILQKHGKAYCFVVDGDMAKPLAISIIASGIEGIAVDDKIADKKIVVAKPDILLKLLAGVRIKEQ